MTKHSIKAIGASAALMVGFAAAALAQDNSDKIDRSANLRFSWVAAPAAYDPPFSKNKFQEMPYMMPVYDTLIQFDVNGEIIPSLATSWKFSDDGLAVTMKLRQGVKFSDGTDLDAATVVKSLNRTKDDPKSLLAPHLASISSFEAADPSTVVIKLKNADANVLYGLATSAGMIISAKALDGGVDLATTTVGTGPYRLISSGPQGARYERNNDYFNKSQNQFAQLSIIPIADATARLNALQTGQIDAGLFQSDQWPEIESMVKSGKFTVHSALGPNSLPLWINTKIKPLDNPKVRLALAMAIDRDAISKGVLNGRCEPAAQPLQPGVVGHDPNLKPYPRDLAKAKALLQEAGVGPFSFDVVAQNQEPTRSVAIAIAAQLKEIGVTVNINPQNGPAVMPMFRGGTYGSMMNTAAVAAPDPASIIDALYMSADNPGGVTPQFADAVAKARTKPLGSPEREAAYKAISKMAYENPNHILVCWSPTLVVARKGLMGVDKTAFIKAVPIPDTRTYAFVKAE